MVTATNVPWCARTRTCPEHDHMQAHAVTYRHAREFTEAYVRDDTPVPCTWRNMSSALLGPMLSACLASRRICIHSVIFMHKHKHRQMHRQTTVNSCRGCIQICLDLTSTHTCPCAFRVHKHVWAFTWLRVCMCLQAIAGRRYR